MLQFQSYKLVPIIPRPLSAEKQFALLTVAMLVLVILSILFIDQAVALYAYHNHQLRNMIHALLSLFFTGPASSTNEIPDFLTPMSLIITVAGWTGYWLQVRRGHFDHHTCFFKMIGTTTPLAFLAKAATKFMFGRINTRVWVIDPALGRGFHWFDGVGSYHGFPSGHMAVLAPLFIALWYFYPRLRALWGAALIGLASALVLTDYHFVSDVIAGTYLGLAVYYLCFKWLIPNNLSRGKAGVLNQ